MGVGLHQKKKGGWGKRWFQNNNEETKGKNPPNFKEVTGIDPTDSNHHNLKSKV